MFGSPTLRAAAWVRASVSAVARTGPRRTPSVTALRPTTIASIAVAFATLTGTTHACRLDGALSHVMLSGPYAPNWLVASEVEAVGFDVAGTQGAYQRIYTRIDYVGLRHFDLGVAVPWAHVDANGTPAKAQGFGNPVFQGRYTRSAWLGGFVSASLQLELPLGSDPAIAADHGELLPQVGLVHEGQLFGAFARFGTRWSLGEHTTETPSPGDAHKQVSGGARVSHATPETHVETQWVDPHAEREVLYRAGLSMRRMRSRWTHALYLDGLHVVRGALPGEARDQWTLGVQTGYQWSWKAFVHPTFEMPLTQNARRDWRLSLTIQHLL